MTTSPSRALAPLLQAARQARAAHGHDAVFGVPAALAHAVCGFRLGGQDSGPAPVFTRLDRQFADIDATLGEIMRVAEGVLLAAGYVQEDASRLYFFAKACERAARPRRTPRCERQRDRAGERANVRAPVVAQARPRGQRGW